MTEISTLCFVSYFVFSQNQEQWDSLENFIYNLGDSAGYDYFFDDFGARFYNFGDCSPDYIPVPGEPVPDYHPNARYINDTSLWEWVPLDFEGIKIKQTHIYDLKPQYKDTLVRNDGSVIEVPIWVKYPGWVKE